MKPHLDLHFAREETTSRSFSMLGPRSSIHRLKQVWTFAGFVALFMLVFNVACAQNLVDNPGFESGTNDWFNLSLGSVTFVVAGGGHSGSACAAITVPPGNWFSLAQSMIDEVPDGQSYTWSAWLRVSSTAPPTPTRYIQLNLHYTYASTNYVRPIALQPLTTTWTEVTTRFDFAPGGAVSNVMISFQSVSSSSPFTFYVDDVSFVDSSPALGITPVSDVVVLSWPTNATGYSLQRKANLALPTSWASVTDPAQTNGDIIFVTLPATNANWFYRLKK
jgi:hypothetical protein